MLATTPLQQGGTTVKSTALVAATSPNFTLVLVSFTHALARKTTQFIKYQQVLSPGKARGAAVARKKIMCYPRPRLYRAQFLFCFYLL